MASGIARRLVGEAEVDPPPPSAAEEWFSSLSASVKDLLVDGSVNDIEVNATVLMIPSDPHGEEFAQRAATWEEAQNPDHDGDWEVVNGPDDPVTAYSVYAHRWNSGSTFIEDYQTHEEALREAHGIAALLGVEVRDLTPSP